jgi:succinoglycan biosynthesis protein ExoM
MVVVAVCTYRRPDLLARLLDSFATLRAPDETAFVVVDNHGDDPAVEDLVKAFAARTGRKAVYAIEREPGISAARNTAFAQARALGANTLAMLDDDEWVTPDWLEALIRERDRTGAKVVGGPVRPVFSSARRHLEQHARFWSVEREFLNGKPFVFCTCNFLLEMEAAAFLGDQPFDHAFGITGGGDTVFFRQLANAGVPMAWTEAAFIYEEIPDSRASVKWLRQRRYRAGNVAFRWEQATPTAGDMNPYIKTLAVIARLPFYPLIRREKSDPWLSWLLEFDKVRGRVAAQFGSHYAEYARDGGGAGKACR